MSELHRRAADAPEPASAAPERATPDRRTDDDRSATPGTLRSHTEFTGDTKDQSPEPDKNKDRGGNNDKPDRNVRLTVDGKPLHEHLDPVGASARDNTIGDQQPDKRTGDHIAEADSDRKSRADRFRKIAYGGSSKIKNGAKEGLSPADAIHRPPTGHPGVDTRPTLAETPHQGVSIPSMVLGVALVGVAAYESGRTIAGKLHNRKGHDNAGHP